MRAAKKSIGKIQIIKNYNKNSLSIVHALRKDRGATNGMGRVAQVRLGFDGDKSVQAALVKQSKNFGEGCIQDAIDSWYTDKAPGQNKRNHRPNNRSSSNSNNRDSHDF